MILNRQRAVRVARQPLEAFLRRVEHEMNLRDSDLTVCLVSDAEIARMNQAFRKKKGPTDVLSFPARDLRTSTSRRKKITKSESAAKNHASRNSREGATYLGDIAIAPQTAKRYAKRNGRSLLNELRVLILHGVLHLLGYDHEADRGEMNRLEQAMRQRFGLA